MLCFMMFKGRMSKNVHDFQKVCLEVTLCVLACFFELYIFIMDETDVIGSNSYKNILGSETSGQNSPRIDERVLVEDLSLGQSRCPRPQHFLYLVGSSPHCVHGPPRKKCCSASRTNGYSTCLRFNLR